MNTSASFTLDFDKVRAVLAGLAATAKGRLLAETLEPSSGIETVRRRLDETSEAKRLAQENARLALEGLPDVESDLQELAIEGRILGVESFLRLAAASAVVHETRRALLARESEAPLLASRAASLPRLEELESSIRRIIDPETETVRDDASRELERIRESTRRVESKLAKLLDQTLSSRDNQKLLQESLVTTRNNRPVVPIKAECRSQFPGIVHGASASGATLFVEPLATVELGNEMAILRDREREEIRRILAELTERVRPRREDVAAAVSVLAEIDLAQAKGRLSEISRGEAPVLTEKSELRLSEARHPLLIPEVAARAGLPREGAAVPLTFGLAEGKRGLVFTGPNTGGKTVALKTAGLLSLMAQAGLHVPARSSSVFPVFQSIFADIGDDQSIGSSLSTFSSHLAKVVAMERELELPALVILDEVGTGTDPAEGGALGTALVEHFLERGAMVLASTHHGLLKAYALTHEGIGAASFEFDPATYAPTYRIVEGAAGRSLAFEMATLLGLPRNIVNRARALESERERQVGELVSRLEAENAEIARERIRLADDRRAAEESRRRLEELQEEERQERRRRLSAWSTSLEEEVDSTRRELREVVAEAKRAIAEIRASRREDRALLSELEKKLSDRIEASTAPLLEKVKAETPKEAFPASSDSIRPGSRVLVASFGMEGIVERIAGDEAEVTVRDKKLKLPVSSLEALPPLAPARSSPAPGAAQAFTSFPQGKQTPEELNLIGCTVDEALSQADKFLDDALLSEYRHVRLIHGHGTGRLKSALREWLSAHPRVEKLESDSRGGVTVVELKD